MRYEHKNDSVSFRGNVCLKHLDRHCESKTSEVIKNVDSVRNLEECFQDEHEKNKH